MAMTRAMQIAMALILLLIGSAAAQVKVEVPRSAVQAIYDDSAVYAGVSIRTPMPHMGGKRELLSAMLWLEVVGDYAEGQE